MKTRKVNAQPPRMQGQHGPGQRPGYSKQGQARWHPASGRVAPAAWRWRLGLFLGPPLERGQKHEHHEHHQNEKHEKLGHGRTDDRDQRTDDSENTGTGCTRKRGGREIKLTQAWNREAVSRRPSITQLMSNKRAGESAPVTGARWTHGGTGLPGQAQVMRQRLNWPKL